MNEVLRIGEAMATGLLVLAMWYLITNDVHFGLWLGGAASGWLARDLGV